MNIKELKDLIHEILQSDISEFELEHTGTKIKLRRGASSEPAPAFSAPPAGKTEAVAAVSVEAPQPRVPGSEETGEDGLHIVSSPIVGTFYRASSPGADPFVTVGQMIEEGTTLCIVEAMKLMNEIPSDIAGEVVRIYVENGHPVEYGQKLFGIRPRN